MVQAHGHPGTAQNWARVQLVRGQSNGGVWQVDQSVPQARLSIGSDQAAGWPVSGFGVLPMHFELYWDGRSLYVADTQRAGGVTINGTPLGGDWVPVPGRAEVAFGQAAFQIETSAALAATAPLESDPSVARRISVTDPGTAEINAESTRIAEPMFDPPSLAGERTMIAEEMSSPTAPRAPSVPPPPPRPGASQRPPPPPMARPRLGGSPSAQAMPAAQVPAPAEATRMVSLDEVPASMQGSLQGGPGGFGAPQPPTFGAPQPGFGAPQPPAFGAPQPPYGQQVGPGGGYGGATVPPAQPAAGTGGFAPPPSFDQAASSPIKSVPKIPPRTLALGGVAVLALVAVLLMGGPAEEEVVAPPPPPPPTAGAPTAGAVPMPGASGIPTPPPPGGVVPPPPPGAVLPPPPPGAVVPPPPGAVVPPPPSGALPGTVPPTPGLGAGIPPLPPGTPPPPSTPPTVEATAPAAPAVDPSTLPPTDDRLAADLVIAGRYAEALPRYQALATANPGRPEYATMVEILTQRLTAMSCVGGLTPDGRPCAVGGAP